MHWAGALAAVDVKESPELWLQGTTQLALGRVIRGLFLHATSLLFYSDDDLPRFPARNLRNRRL